MMLQDARNANPISLPNTPKKRIKNNNVIIIITLLSKTASSLSAVSFSVHFLFLFRVHKLYKFLVDDIIVLKMFMQIYDYLSNFA
jgi:hypothetical protein